MKKKTDTDYTFDYTSKGLEGWHPAIGDALVSISDDGLELNTHFLLHVSTRSTVLSWLYFPGILLFIIYILPDFISNNHFISEFERFHSGILTFEDIMLAMLMPIFVIIALLLPIIFVYIRRRNTTLFFNRKTQHVHALIGGKHYFSDWKDLQLQFVTIKSWNGSVIVLNDGIRFYLKNKKNKTKYLEVEGSGPVEDGVSNRLLNWDFIRVFMDQANDRSTLSLPDSGVMYLIEKAVPFYTPKETFRRWWPLPYKKVEFDFGNEKLRFFNFVKRLLLFPIAIQGELVWFTLMKFIPGKMKDLPPEAREGCKGKSYTIDDVMNGCYPSFVNPNIPRIPESAGKPVDFS